MNNQFCSVDIYVEMTNKTEDETKILNRHSFQTSYVSFDTLVRMIHNVFVEDFQLVVLVSDYLLMKQNHKYNGEFEKSLCIRINKIKHQTDFFNIVIEATAAHKLIRKIYRDIKTYKTLLRDNYLSFFLLKLCEISKEMNDFKKSSSLIKDYVACIRTIDYIKKCNYVDLDSSYIYFSLQMSKKINKFDLYKEFLDIRRERADEIKYYLREKERCEQKKIIC
jgi:hypothetical protein